MSVTPTQMPHKGYTTFIQGTPLKFPFVSAISINLGHQYHISNNLLLYNHIIVSIKNALFITFGLDLVSATNFILNDNDLC